MHLLPRKTFSNEEIQNRIYLIRGHRVMIDRELAELYGVETKYLNRQVKRNKERFPEEFMFPLNKAETRELVTNCHRFQTLKYSSTQPYAFTEHGVAMLASVLGSRQAVKTSIFIIKTFVRFKEWLTTHKELALKFSQLEKKIEKHDTEIQAIFQAIRQLMAEPQNPKQKIGFHGGKS